MAGIDRKVFYWLLGLNIAVFVAVRICAAMGNDVLPYIALPAGWAAWAHRPWTIVTFMVTQYDVLHLVFNMLWLWTFHTISIRIAAAGRRPVRPTLLPVTYLAGGLAAAVVFVSTSAGILVGSSSSVLAYAAAIAVTSRRHRFNMALFGEMPLSVLTAVVIVLVLVGAPSPVSHAAGVMAGVAVALGPKIARKLSPRGRLDALERRVSSKGFNSLSHEERSELFYLSRRYKK